MEEPREYRKEEIEKLFLEEVWGYINYWEVFPNQTCREKLSGLAHSLLVIIDGESSDLPGFILAPYPHENDKDYHKSMGENYFPTNYDEDASGDIAGGLHNLFYTMEVKPSTEFKGSEADYYESLRLQVNTLSSNLKNKPDKYKLGYRHTVGSILNAYREGDVSFRCACDLLEVKEEEKETN